jgi:hypothetical protein
VTPSVGQNYDARKQLFAKGLKYGRLTASEIEAAVPEGTLTAAERWLLFYSLRAAEVEIIDDRASGVPPEPAHENPAC